jgi:hypothetical protein
MITWIDDWHTNMVTERVLRCFGSEKVFQCKIAPKPNECLKFLDSQILKECTDDSEEIRR